MFLLESFVPNLILVSLAMSECSDPVAEAISRSFISKIWPLAKSHQWFPRFDSPGYESIEML